MIRHYLASALRNFRRRPLNTAIKLLALSLGLACLLTAHVIGDFFTRADSQWAKAKRVHVVEQQTARAGGGWDSIFMVSGPPLAGYLRADFPELETVARLSLISNAVGIEGGDRTWPGYGADAQFLDVFDLDMVAGEAALDRPYAILIDTQVAEQAFGGAQAALGRTMTLADGTGLEVAGVFRAIASPSHLSGAGVIELRVLTSMTAFDGAFAGTSGAQALSELDNFASALFVTYAVLPADGSLTAAAFETRLEAFADRRVPPAALATRFIPVSLPQIGKAVFDQRVGDLFGASLLMALYLLGALTLAIGCVNFANLAAAEAANRAREIGLRKTLGATRGQVAAQMLVESGLLAAAALVLVLPVSALLAMALGRQFGLQLALPGPADWDYWVSAGLVAAAAAVAAGAYPALVLAGVRPVFAIRMRGQGGGAGLVRTVLISIQFAAAGFLLTLMLVMLAQKSELRREALRPDRDPIVTLSVPTAGFYEGVVDMQVVMDRVDALAQRLLASPAVTGVTFRAGPPYTRMSGQASEYGQSLEPGAPRISGQARGIYYDYFQTMDVEILAGRSFDREQDDSRAVMIDAPTARLLGLTPEEAVGQPIYRTLSRNTPAPGADSLPPEFTIVGVVEREPLELEARGPANYLYVLQPSVSVAMARLSRDNVDRGLADIRAVWAERFPDERPDPVFLDTIFDGAYRSFTMINVVFAVLSAIALVIAAMGLFGLASFVVQRRVREIGVRKTLGARRGQVLRLFLWDFSRPVLLANLLAWPFAFVAARMYLELFVTRIALTPAPFLAALAFTLLIAWLAVGGHAWRAAGVKPANVLKYE